MSNTSVRVIVGIIGVPLIIYLVHIGNELFTGFCILISFLCMNEFYNLFEKPARLPGTMTKWANGFSLDKIAFLIINSLIVIYIYYEKFNFVLILYFIMFIFLILRELFKKEKHFEAIGTWLLSIVYISSPFGILSMMASSKFKVMFGANYALICLILIWISDTFAFWGGKSFGKHKLAPSISPKKTWEGSVSGLFFTILAGGLLYFTLNKSSSLFNNLLIALIVGLAAQLGDLFESHLKRTAKVKDSSTIVPGHGGILDRFDSLLFAAPALYIYLYIKNFVL